MGNLRNAAGWWEAGCALANATPGFNEVYIIINWIEHRPFWFPSQRKEKFLHICLYYTLSIHLRHHLICTMQLNAILTTLALLATTSTAFPSAGPLRIAKISGSNSTATGRATAPGEGGHRNWPKITSPDTTHGANKKASSDSDGDSNCSALCAIAAQACVVAVPDDESFCWDTYIGCTDRCH
ncbi:hypothetical protein BDW42DRAFT_162996 [Aspergillus taichungensis]|uniref:Uncharacterized protein n=1 Tax=Aspergillus taichungensis TaxID=482145 RepID=A0A2J5I3C6_9EURO|nr:hypothetical protein BDW42DRAFT_162996 [Aspergillus taichungensis]